MSIKTLQLILLKVHGQAKFCDDVIEKVVIVRKGKWAKNFNAEKVFSEYMKMKPELDKQEAEENRIKAVNSGEDLVLTHSSTQVVRVNNVLGITALPNPLLVPSIPTNGAKIYTGAQSIGGTGIYFVNQDQTRDELVSRSKSILYGIIF